MLAIYILLLHVLHCWDPCSETNSSYKLSTSTNVYKFHLQQLKPPAQQDCSSRQNLLVSSPCIALWIKNVSLIKLPHCNEQTSTTLEPKHCRKAFPSRRPPLEEYNWELSSHDGCLISFIFLIDFSKRWLQDACPSSQSHQLQYVRSVKPRALRTWRLHR